VRLHNVDRGDGIASRAKLLLIRLVSGRVVPGVVRTLFYRSAFFGAHHNRLTQQVMRGPSEWTVGERELMAAFVSRVNQCPF
jgi:hypothetical protein